MKTVSFYTGILALAAAALAQPSPQKPVPDRLDLPNALLFAIENNFAIRQARERIKQQEGVLIEVKARQITNAAINGAYTKIDSQRLENFGGVRFGDTQGWQIGLELRQTVYAGGGVSAGVRAQEHAREAARLELEGVINEQLLLVRTRFYDVLLAHKRIGVREDTVKLLEEQLKDARSRFEAGTTSHFEVLRAEVELANARPPLIQARNNFRLAVEELRQALGFATNTPENVDRIPEFVGSLEVGKPETASLPDALAAARANRPELKRLAMLEDSREESVAAARSGNRPTLDLVGGYLVQKSNFSSSLGDTVHGWSVGVQSSWPIFDGRKTAGRVAQARSLLQQIRLSLGETRLGVEIAVRRAHSSLQEAWELVESTGKVVEQAREALRLANARYAAGAATQLDVLTSQVSLTQARLNQLEAYHGYHVALAALRQAMGLADEYVK